MAAASVSFLSTSFSASRIFSDKPHPSPPVLPFNSFQGVKLSLRRTRFSKLLTKCHSSTTATVLCNLPTEKFASVKSPKWSARAIRSFQMGRVQAKKLKYPETGTESLLLGILIEGTSPAAKFLRANGINFFNAQDELLKLLGKAPLIHAPPLEPPLTVQAQRALDWAIEEKLKSGDDGEITTTYILLGIWADPQSAGHKILEKFGFNDEKAKELSTKFAKEKMTVSFR